MPEIAKIAAKLTVFQRTPPWVVPRLDFKVGALHQMLRKVPGLQRIERALIYWRNEAYAMAFLGNRRIQNLIKAAGRWHMRRGLNLHADNPTAPHQHEPNYAPGCKRILVSDDWYPTLARSNVRVIHGAPPRIGGNSVMTDQGESVPTDVIVYGTGFVVQEFVSPLRVFGREGIELSELWRDAAETYCGVCVNQFPNFFALVGPNTGLGHNSIVFMIEAQVRWIVKAMRALRA
jgi:cation diffusion facilitator CzcD-associated flavoprotein CzcO